MGSWQWRRYSLPLLPNAYCLPMPQVGTRPITAEHLFVRVTHETGSGPSFAR